jgi:hypothetical protein
MLWGHSSLWWSFVIAGITIVLTVPLSIFGNMMTPVVLEFAKSWSQTSLAKKIAKTETKLAELEKNPEITEAEDRILSSVNRTKIQVVNFANLIVLMNYLAATIISKSSEMRTFGYLVSGVVVFNNILIYFLHFNKDFRYCRSPRVRKNLRKSIEEMKALRTS